MTRELKQILHFKDWNIDASGWKPIAYDYVESKDGVTPERAYLDITSRGKNEGKVNDLKALHELILCKKRRDFQKKQWTDGLREGIVIMKDFDGDEVGLDIFYDCVKDFIKTESRMDMFKRLGDNDLGALAACQCRNWFMDKLDLKLPDDIHDKDCYTCREEFWVTGKYVSK